MTFTTRTILIFTVAMFAAAAVGVYADTGIIAYWLRMMG